MKNFFLTLLTIFISNFIFAQIVWTDPVFPTQDDYVTIYYDATQGNGQCAGVIPMYCHTGVITNFSSSETDWQHVVGNWGTADPNVIMTPESTNIHSFDFGGLTLAEFYNLSGGEEISSLAFVFRNQNGSLQGKTADNGDIFYSISDGSFNAVFFQPTGSLIYNIGETVNVNVQSSASAQIDLYLDGGLVTSVTDETLLTYEFEILTDGEIELEFVANDGTNEVTETITLVVLPEIPVLDPTEDVIDGINYLSETSVILQLYAPFKDHIFVIGDFNDWSLDLDYLMNQRTDGETYWLELNGLTPGEEYRFQYLIADENMKIADIYSEKILDFWNDPWIPEETYPDLIGYPNGLTSDAVSILQTAQTDFEWTDAGYVSPPSDRLVVYEMLIRDFVDAKNYQTVQDSLDYLENLGVNAIELMPVNEFEGNESWGYNCSFFFAPDKFYGSKEAFQSFVDECHSRGIAVIMDIALNHSFGQNPQVRMYFDASIGDYGQTTAENPWFNEIPMHDFNVGYDYNHENPKTRAFMKRILAHWLEEYHIDGYRLDLSKGFTQNNTLGNTGAWGNYDQSRIDILNDYKSHIESVAPDSYIILEHFADNDEETALSNQGFMLWGNLNHEYNEATMGFNSNLNWGSYQARGWNDPNLVTFMESHDEERLMYKNSLYGNSNGTYDITDLTTGLERVEMANCFFIPIPGPKMIWQFGELGYDYSINYCQDDGTINEDCRTYPKPIEWGYFEDQYRRKLYLIVSALNHLKATEPAFSTNDFSLDVDGIGKRIHLNHSSMDVCIVGNFGVAELDMIPGFQNTGTWYDYFTGESIDVTDLNASQNLQAGEYHIYTSQPLEVPDIATDIIELGDLNILAFPNPFEDHIFIQSSALGQSINFELYNLQGQLIERWNERTFGRETTVRLEINSNISKGMYILKASGEEYNRSIPVYKN